jgi:hypothetical protein
MKKDEVTLATYTTSLQIEEQLLVLVKTNNAMSQEIRLTSKNAD